MRVFIAILLSFSLTAHASNRPDEIVQAELKAQLIALELQVNDLLANGLDEGHPKLLTLTNRVEELKQDIAKLEPPKQETIILLEGTSATSLTSGQKIQLKEMLGLGWHIHSLTPAGENKAYLWLKK